MSLPRKLARRQMSLFIAFVVLAVYYVAIYRPLSDKERAQAAPFEAMQARLRTAGTNNPAVSGLSDETLKGLEQSLLQSLTNLARAREVIAERYAPEPAIVTNLSRPFQLIDYQNDRLGRRDRLVGLAAERKVKLAPAVIAGLPEFTVENPGPELLWGQLSLADGMLRAAIEARVVSVEQLSMAAPVNHPTPASSEHRLVELPLRLEVVGTFDSVSRLLAIVLLDSKARAELKLTGVDGLPGATLQHILLRKETTQPPGNVRLAVEFRGFLRLPATGSQ
jgi:hypothetical protein